MRSSVAGAPDPENGAIAAQMSGYFGAIFHVPIAPIEWPHQINPVLVDLVLLRTSSSTRITSCSLRSCSRRVVRIGRRRSQSPAVPAVDAIAQRRGDDVAVLFGERRERFFS